MVDQASTAVVPTEDSTNDRSAGFSNPAQVRISREIPRHAGTIVTFGDLDAFRLLPEAQHSVVILSPESPRGDFTLHMRVKEYTLHGMNLRTLKATLLQHPSHVVRFVLPDGDPIPARFHVTEVGHVTRRFIDCGGTVRSLESCLLQTWVPEGDSEHRLTAGKLAKILDLSRQVVPSDELEVEVGYDCCVVGQYTIEGAASKEEILTFTLGNKKTDCLARETCGVDPAAVESGCCGSGCGCS